MTDNTTSRISTIISSIFLLCIACLLYFGPDFLGEDHSKEVVWILKLAWMGITVVALLAPFESFNTWVVVNDDGLRKCNLFFQQRFLRWSEIQHLERKKDSGDIHFRCEGKSKISVNLRFNGWEDLREYAAKHLQPDKVLALSELIDRE